MTDIVLTHDDTESTYSLEDVSNALPDGYSILSDDELSESFVNKDVVKSEYVPKSEFKRRLKSAKDNAHEDESVIARVLDSNQPTDVPDKEQLYEQWNKAYLEPKEQELSDMMGVAKSAKIRELASEYFDDAFTHSPEPGVPSYAEVALSKHFAYDGETFPVDSNGEALVPLDPRSGRNRRTGREHMSVIAEDPAYKNWLKEPEKGGGGSGRPGDDLNPGSDKSLDGMTDTELAAGIRNGNINARDLLKF